MALRASTQSVADAYANILRQAVATKAYMTARKTQFQQPTTNADAGLAVIQHCQQVLALFAGWAATPGLAAYAQQQTNDPTYDVAAEYTAMRNALQALRDDLISRFPKSVDANLWLQYQQLQADGSITVRTFTAAQLAPTLPLIDAVTASIA